VTRVAVVALLALGLAGLAGAAGRKPGGRPVVLPGCDGLYYERTGFPQRLIVSDLPLEASAHTAMRQMTQAIKLTLKDRGFRAGRFSVGYVSCDDSGAAGTWSAGRCVKGARVELPVLAAAHLVLVSPLNTATDLTRLHRGGIARLTASDDVQAQAAARFLRRAGARTVAARSDGTQRGDHYRAAFVRAARRNGLQIVRRGRADAAYLGGVLSARSREDLLAARRLAPRGLLALCAGYGPAAQLTGVAGTVAEGAYLFVAGIPDEHLGKSGQSFVLHFERAVGTAPHPYAVYAAQSSDLLLDAIASTNGKRAAIGRGVLGAKVSRGLIGSFSFDANGDPTFAPVTVFRVHNRSTQFVRIVD
jgi:branched-chain amino acid transport system substrate-binding protein